MVIGERKEKKLAMKVKRLVMLSDCIFIPVDKIASFHLKYEHPNVLVIQIVGAPSYEMRYESEKVARENMQRLVKVMETGELIEE